VAQKTARRSQTKRFIGSKGKAWRHPRNDYSESGRGGLQRAPGHYALSPTITPPSTAAFQPYPG
jgi:hypothetical protein